MSKIKWKSEKLGRSIGTIETHCDESLVDAWAAEGYVEKIAGPAPVEDRALPGPAANRSMKPKKDGD